MSRVNLPALTRTPFRQTEQVDAGQRSRPDRKQLSLCLPVLAGRPIRKVAHEKERSIHGCVLEGLDLLFAQRGLAPLADLVEEREKE